MRNNRAVGRSAGFTLVEVGITMGLLAVVAVSALRLVQDAQQAFESGVVQSQLDAKARRVVARIADELRSAGANGLILDLPSGGGVNFQRSEGWSAGNIQWGPVLEIAFAYAPGELDNGVDDDGNGLVDDGEVVWIQSPGAGEQRVVLSRGVAELAAGEAQNLIDDNGNGLIDEPGLSFEQGGFEGRNLTIRLTLEQAVAGGGATSRSTVETTVVMKN